MRSTGRILIVEGLDCTGKSSFIDAARSILSTYTPNLIISHNHLQRLDSSSQFKSQRLHHQGHQQMALRMARGISRDLPNSVVIFDRFHLTEAAALVSEGHRTDWTEEIDFELKRLNDLPDEPDVAVVFLSSDASLTKHFDFVRSQRKTRWESLDEFRKFMGELEGFYNKSRIPDHTLLTDFHWTLKLKPVGEVYERVRETLSKLEMFKELLT